MAAPQEAQQATDLALEHYDGRQSIVNSVAAQVGDAWSQVDPAKIVDSWAEQLPTVTATVTAGQAAAAGSADAYTGETLAAQGIAEEAAASVAPAGFAGQAADGGMLVSLLTNPVFVT